MHAINNVLTAIQQQLVINNVFTESECFLSVEPQKIEYLGGCYCAITPGRINIDQGFVEGAGIYGGFLCLTINIRLWSQNALDESSRDTLALTQNTLGVYSKFGEIMNTLQMFTACQTPGAIQEPMRLINVERAARDLTRPEWIFLDSVWEVRTLL
jgi:hypothetical protein